MIIAFIIFCLSFLGLVVFLIGKAPVLAGFSEQKDDSNDFIIAAKEKIEEGVKKEIRERVEEILHSTLSILRKIILRFEHITTKWLYALKRKRRKREENKPE